MAPPESRREITGLRERVGELLNRAVNSAVHEEELLQKSLQELMAALEELSIAEEELQRQNKELTAAHQRYQDLFQFAPDGYLVTDSAGVIHEANQRASSLLNAPVEFLLGKPLVSFIAESDRLAFHTDLSRLVKSIRLHNWEMSVQPNAREPFTAAISVGTAKDQNGEVTGLRWLIRDISERKRVEMALAESEERYRNLSEKLEAKVAEQVEKLKRAETLTLVGEMVAVIAHEIKNPLQSINYAVDALKRIEYDQKISQILNEIDHAANQMNGVVAELLYYVRAVRMERALYPIQDIVVQALGYQSRRLQNISLNLDIEKKEIFVDADKMIRVFSNIISNAVDAMPNGGNLKICSQCVKSDGQSVLKLYVSDTGCGVSQELLEKIQEPFFTTKAKGVGLGIPICRKILEVHDGSMSVQSTVNQGTTVEIMLPL